MSDKSKDTDYEQLVIDDILKMSNDAGKCLSSNDLTAAIEKLCAPPRFRRLIPELLCNVARGGALSVTKKRSRANTFLIKHSACARGRERQNVCYDHRGNGASAHGAVKEKSLYNPE